MVEAVKSFDKDLYNRIRDKFDSDEQCKKCVDHIITSRMKTWSLPTLHEVQCMNKEHLISLLQYCPESNYYYASDTVIKEMVDNQSRQDIFQKVKALIFEKTVANTNGIEEVSSEYEKSLSVEMKIEAPVANIVLLKVPDTASNMSSVPKTIGAAAVDEPEESKEDNVVPPVSKESEMVAFGSNLHQ